jgi:hypothetical protein
VRTVTRAEGPTARAERLIAELRAATSEAAGVLKDLRAGMKEARGQVDGYLVEQMTDTIAAVHREMRARAQRYMLDMLGKIEGRAFEAIALAEETIATANTLDVLVDRVTAELCKHTIYVDGYPVIRFGTTISPDGEDHL